MNVSIVIPTFNEADRIGQNIEYLRNYGANSLLEIIVVDGGSTDETVKLAEAAGARVFMAERKGRAIQMNTGAQMAQGEILYFVHADSTPPQSYLGDLTAALSNGSQMGCFRYKFDSPSRLLKVNAYFTRFSFLFCQGGDKTFFIRREVFFALGAYNSNHVIMEEYDFLRRASKAGYKLDILPQNCLVSARKYEKNSWLRVQLANVVVFNLWVWKLAKPEKLQAIYRGMLH
jgi:rSAM/selenodomain-associated transferase 2